MFAAAGAAPFHLQPTMTGKTPKTFRCGDLLVDCGNFRVHKSGKLRTLSPLAFDVLVLLIEQQGSLVTKQELFDTVWNETFVTDNALTRVIKEIRQAIGDEAYKPRYIETVPKRGYRFVADVAPVETAFMPDTQPNLPTMAVLPFKIFASEDDEYLGLGMADALITRLSNVGQLIVRPTSAVLRYSRSDQDSAAIGRELRTEFVLEGTIRKSNELLRTTAQLIGVADGRLLWASRFDERLADIFSVEDSICEKVANALSLALTGAERKLLTKRYTTDADAFESYLKGRFFANKFTLENFRKAIAAFDRALEFDPDFALAYAGIAEAFWNAADTFLNPREAMEKSKAAALKAVAADDSLAEGHAFLACAKYSLDWDWVGLEQEYRRAIELTPGFAQSYQWFGWCLSVMGRHDEAIAALCRAKQLDPFSLGANWFLSSVYDIARRYDEAIEQAETLIDLEPNFWGGHWALGRTYADQEDYSRAIAAYEKAAALGTSTWIKGSLAEAHALNGEEGQARLLLGELQAQERDGYVPGFFLALIHLALGEDDEAFDSLEKAYQQHDSGLPLINVYKPFDRVRNDPRLLDLIKKIGLQS